MTANSIDSFWISLGVDPTAVKEGMDKAQSFINNGLSVIKQMLAPLAGAFAVGKLTATYLQQADALGRLSDALGVDMADLQAWGEVVEDSGGSVEGLQGTVQSLTMQLSQMSITGTSRVKPFFDSMGVSMTDSKGKVRGVFDVMEDLSDKFSKMDKQKAYGIGTRLGMDRGTIALLQQGRKAVEEHIAKEKELGGFTKRDAEIAKKFNLQWSDFVKGIKYGSAVILQMVIPMATKVLDKLTQGVEYLRKHEAFVKTVFLGIAAIIMAKVIPAFAAWATAMLANPITWIIAAIVALGLVIDDLVTYAKGGKSHFEKFWKSLFGSPKGAANFIGSIYMKFQKFIDWVKQAAKWVTDFGKKFSKAMSPLSSTLKPLESGLKKLFGIFYDVFKICKNVWKILLDLGGASNGWELLTKAAELFAAALNKILDIWNYVLGGLKTGLDWLADKFDWLSDIVGGLTKGNKFFGKESGVSAGGGGGSGWGGTARAALPASASAKGNTKIDSNVNVGKIEVHTAATDAPGIAKDMGKATQKELGRRNLVMATANGISR